MITSEQLNIYKKYGQDGDWLLRMGTTHEKATLDYESLSLINDLMQDLVLIRRGLVSLDYAERTIEALNNVCDNEETIKLFHEIADSEA
jgi:hypothetical protein